MDVTEVINSFGGYKEAQRLLGVSLPLLFRWEEVGIPPKRWSQIVGLARQKGISGLDFEALSKVFPSRIRTPRKRPSDD